MLVIDRWRTLCIVADRQTPGYQTTLRLFEQWRGIAIKQGIMIESIYILHLFKYIGLHTARDDVYSLSFKTYRCLYVICVVITCLITKS